jgi:hypothetical protein
MKRYWLGFWIVLALASPAAAGVVALANFTPKPVTFTLTEPGGKPRTVRLSPAEVSPVRVSGPATIAYTAAAGEVSLRVDPYTAYVFVGDEKAGLRLEGVEMPGQAPERDDRPELNPAPPEPVKVPVTLLVDDADPRADDGWQKAIGERFETAAKVVESHSGVRFTVAGFARWRSDRRLKDLPSLLGDFETQVKVKPGQVAVGFTSRPVQDDPNQPGPFGACRPFPASHILIREWQPKADSEKVEVLIHHLGLALGATLTPDEGSVMRPDIANGLARHADYRYRFDPLNVLAMSIWGEELRRGPLGNAGDATAASRMRLTRIYQAMVKVRPGDSLSLTYLNAFDAAMAKEPMPKVEPKKPDPLPEDPARVLALREEVARAVVRAVAARARANAGPEALRGDALTDEYVRTAALAAVAFDGLAAESPDRVSGFLLGLAIALDDTGALRDDPYTAEVARAVESDSDRESRLAVLGSPTLRGRRDLCRRFAIGCGTGELLTSRRAEEVAVNRLLGLAEAKRPAGISFPTLAAELAGIALARSAHDDEEFLKRTATGFKASEHFPGIDGLRDGLTIDRFEADFGEPRDPRFLKVLDDIRGRIKNPPAGGM